MDLPTIQCTQEKFDSLRILPTGAYDQPEGKYRCSTGQWLYIAPGQCGVLEIVPENKHLDTGYKHRLPDPQRGRSRFF